jgi:hypothetical protein
LQVVLFVNAEYFFKDVVFHTHVLPNEEYHILDQADPQNGEVVFEEYVQVLVCPVHQELVYEDMQLHTHHPRRLLAVVLQHTQTTRVYDAETVL